jgi:very-short-patch-repair endonuclease
MEASISRLIERHRAARRFAVPTLTVIATRSGAPPGLDELWRRTGTAVVTLDDPGDIDAIAALFFGGLGATLDLRRAALEAIAAVLGQPVPELELRLASAGGPEREALLATYQDRERRRGVAALVAALATGSDPPGPLEALRAIGRMLERPPTLALRPATDVAGTLERGVDIVVAAPELGVVIVADPGSVDAFLAAADDRAATVVRHGLIRINDSVARAPAAEPSSAGHAAAARERAIAAYRDALAGGEPDLARSAAEALLFARLQAAPPTAGRFHLNQEMPFHFGHRPAEVDLLCPDLDLAVEVDGYFHFTDSAAYRRDRRKDVLLQSHGVFVVRCLADDVVERLEEVVSDIVDVMRWRAARREENDGGDRA